jgi:hypothetical protein
MSSPPPPAALPPEPLAAAVDWAITSRRSARTFLPTPVPREQPEAILTVASRAPSGTNLQPWKVHVVTGEANDINPVDYLADVIPRVQTHLDSRIDELLPHNWSSPRAEPPT